MKQRDNLFDSLKFILIFLVVLGHIFPGLWDARYLAYSWTERNLSTAMFTFIYSFHMPFFVFISGYFSKNMTLEKFKRGFLPLIVSYLIFQFLSYVPDIIKGQFDVVEFLFEPFGHLWYIICLILWRFTFCFLPKLKIKPLLLIGLSVFIGLSIGFIPVTLPYTVIRYFAFMPFFIMGVYCTRDVIDRIRSVNKLYGWAIIMILVIFVWFAADYLMTSTFLLFPYTLIGNSNVLLGLLKRVVLYGMAVVLSMCVINVATTRFAKWGSGTMTIYLLHMPLIFLYKLVLAPYLGLTPALWLDLLVFIVIFAICLLLSRINFIQYIVDPVSVYRKKHQNRS